MKKVIVLLVFAALALAPMSAQQRVKGAFAVPAGIDLDRYPTMNRPFTELEINLLKLEEKTLEKPVVVLNHFRNLQDSDGRFVYEKLKAGTKVLVDKETGELRYKADCRNRISEVKPPITNPITTDKMEKPIGASGSQKKIAETTNGGFWNNFKKAWDSVWSGIGTLFGGLTPLLLALLGLLAIGLIVYLIYQSIQDAKTGRQQRLNPQPVVPVAPAPAPLYQTYAIRRTGTLPVEPAQPATATSPAQPAPAPAARRMHPQAFTFTRARAEEGWHHFEFGDDIAEFHAEPIEGGGTGIDFRTA